MAFATVNIFLSLNHTVGLPFWIPLYLPRFERRGPKFIPLSKYPAPLVSHEKVKDLINNNNPKGKNHLLNCRKHLNEVTEMKTERPLNTFSVGIHTILGITHFTARQLRLSKGSYFPVWVFGPKTQHSSDIDSFLSCWKHFQVLKDQTNTGHSFLTFSSTETVGVFPVTGCRDNVRSLYFLVYFTSCRISDIFQALVLLFEMG